MLKREIKSGAAEIISSGSVFSYRGEDIFITVAGVKVVFRSKTVANKESKITSFSEINSTDVYVFEIVNVKARASIGEPHPIADMWDLDNSQNRFIFEVFFEYTSLNDNLGNYKIDYTFFRVPT